jgi:hypothetical protein
MLRISARKVTDLAGNPLDGSSLGRSPTGAGRPGTDFVVTLSPNAPAGPVSAAVGARSGRRGVG